MKTPGSKTGEFSLNDLDQCPSSLFYWIPDDIKLNQKISDCKGQTSAGSQVNRILQLEEFLKSLLQTRNL